MCDQAVSELLGRFGSEEAHVRKGQLVDLGVQCRADLCIGMAKA